MSQITEPVVIPVVEEEVEIGRRLVEAGRVRIHKRTEHVPVELSEPMELERVRINRVPAGRILDAPAQVRVEGDVTIVPVMEERVVKVWYLVEELHLVRTHEQVEAREQLVLQRDIVEVERLDPRTGQWHPDADGPPAANPNPSHRTKE